jgi:hypothetical protein
MEASVEIESGTYPPGMRMRRVILALFVLTPVSFSFGAEKIGMPKPVDSSPPPQRITVECSPPDVIIQAVGCGCDKSGPLQRCHFRKAQPMYYGAPSCGYSAPYAVAPTFSFAAPTFAAPSFAAPSFAAPSFAAPSFAMPSYGVSSFAAPMAAPMAMPSMPLTLPSSISLSAPLSIAPPSSYGIPLLLTAPNGGARAASAEAEAQGTTAKTDVNEALKKLSNSIELLTRIVEKHTTYLENHEERLKSLDVRVKKLEDKKLEEKKQP